MSVKVCLAVGSPPRLPVLARLGTRREGHPCENTWAEGKWTDDLL